MTSPLANNAAANPAAPREPSLLTQLAEWKEQRGEVDRGGDQGLTATSAERLTVLSTN